MSVDGPGRPPDPPPPPPRPEPPRNGAGDHMDPILAANVAAMREDSARMRAQGDEQGALQSDAAAARYEAMISPGYQAEAGSDSAAADGQAGAQAMAAFEASMDPINAEAAAAMREDSARMRAQGNEEGAVQSDAAAARAEALTSPDYQTSSEGPPGAEPPQAEPPADGAGDDMDPILAFNAAEIRREADLLRSQGNEEGARQCEAAAARYEAMISPGYFAGRGR